MMKRGFRTVFLYFSGYSMSLDNGSTDVATQVLKVSWPAFGNMFCIYFEVFLSV